MPILGSLALLTICVFLLKLAWDNWTGAEWIHRLNNPKPWHPGVAPWRIRKKK